uniref:pyridoxal 5'-phosphate synthase n=2 Tax=Schistocephalus solidus TaxID=70667 RepID=A0A0X3PLD2_SCHSO
MRSFCRLNSLIRSASRLNRGMPYLDIKSMRIPYRKEVDRFTDFSLKFKNPFLQFKQWFEEAVTCPDVFEANAMVLSTVSREGRPSSRFVLLKGLDERGFQFFTNASSQKGKEMETNKHVSLLFYWEPLKRQVRINGEATLLPEEEAVSYFSSRPKSSQIAAFVSDQSAPVCSDAALLSEFKKAEKEFDSTSTVPKPKSWVGYSVMPDSVEFWQGQTNRLHDRILFFRPNSSTPMSEFAKPGDDGWYYERLAP